MHEAIKDQHEIGWQQFLEGLPARRWQMLLKSSQRWLRGLLFQLHHLGHRQWKHQCEVKDKATRPTEREQEDNLHKVIEEEYIRGAGSLMPGDRSLLDYNLVQLLNRTLAYKIGWVTRVGAAQQRAISKMYG
jgi:hypothetical protein